MKRGKLILSILLILILIFPLIIALDNDNTDNGGDSGDAVIDTEQSQIDRAYDCLETKVEGNCGSLSLEERIFSLLAIGECKAEIISQLKDGQCLPSPNCNIKQTAQAVLALNENSKDADELENWLLNQKGVPENLIWYLQIDAQEEATCTISYLGGSYSVTIGDNKKINTGAGSCLSLSPSGYFTISCNKNFLTNLLYQKKGSGTIFVSEKTSSALPEGKTTEVVDSYCFKQGNSCDYEGSLWAALVLNNEHREEINSFIPYLIAMSDEDENKKYLPEAFLYFLTNKQDFYNDLIGKQKMDKYWDESGDKFYDTAVSLLLLQYQTPVEKTNAINWLLEVQDSNGCWKGNIRNTAFLLYAIWPRSAVTPTTENCEDQGYYCMSSIECQDAEGNEKDYYCPYPFVCCDKQYILPTCAEQGGIICNSNQRCSLAGQTVSASDLDIGQGQTCCVGGICEEIQIESECERFGGMCRLAGCNDNEEIATYACEGNDICCIEKPPQPKKNYLWIWILVILIVLVILGIIFRDRLRPYYMRITHKFKRKPPSEERPIPGRPGPPFTTPQARRPMPRRIIPSQTVPRPRRPVKTIVDKEFSDVLKKLKGLKK